MKLIDFVLKGNQLKLFFGDDDCKDYWGDDWNDAPYEHNAGEVYSEYVKSIGYWNLDFEDEVVEPCTNTSNYYYSKEDMKKRETPCIAYIKHIEYPYISHPAHSMGTILSLEKSQRIYFGDSYESIVEKLGEPVRIVEEIENV